MCTIKSVGKLKTCIVGLGMFFSVPLPNMCKYVHLVPSTPTSTHIHREFLLNWKKTTSIHNFSHLTPSIRWHFSSSCFCLLHSPTNICVYRRGILLSHFCKQKMLQQFIFNPTTFRFLVKKKHSNLNTYLIMLW